MQLLDGRGYFNVVWALGRFGKQLRTMTIDASPYDKFFQDLLELSEKTLPQMDIDNFVGTIQGPIPSEAHVGYLLHRLVELWCIYCCCGAILACCQSAVV